MITVLIPALNEEDCIERTINSLKKQVGLKESLEIIVLDGGSDDATPSIAARALGPHGTVVENPGRTVPEAVRVGLIRARGDKIVVAGAHAEYPDDFLRALAENIDIDGVGAVGGVLVSKPTDPDSSVSVAIADTLSSRFGVGVSHRTAVRTGEIRTRSVATVAFPMYRREVFEQIRGYDPRFIRGHDLEYHMRLLSAGWRILQVPSVRIGYFVRSTLRSEARMAFNYGYWKPLVNACHNRLSSIRQLFPLSVVLVLVLALVGVTGRIVPRWTAIGGLGYVVGVFVAAVLLGIRTKRSRLIPIYIVSFMILHVGYGLGYLAGLAESTLKPISRRSTQA